MTDEEKKIEQRVLPWRLWFSITLTGFLIVTFGLYLPTWFRYQALTGVHGEMKAMPEMHNAMAGGEHNGHGSSAYHEAKDVREGLSVDLHTVPVPV